MTLFFKRLFKIGEAKTNSAIASLEDPIKMTIADIQEMKTDLYNHLEELSQIRALAIRSETEAENFVSKIEAYQQKAISILKKSQNRQLETIEADQIAKEALVHKEEAQQQLHQTHITVEKLKNDIHELNATIVNIKKSISKRENELKTLEARERVSNAIINLNKHMAQIDSNSTIAMLESMKEKERKAEAIEEAASTIANTSKSAEDEIDQATDTTQRTIVDDLARLKQQLGMRQS